MPKSSVSRAHYAPAAAWGGDIATNLVNIKNVDKVGSYTAFLGFVWYIHLTVILLQKKYGAVVTR